MADATLKKQLLDARETLIAQLNDIEFRATAAGISRHGGGPPDYGSVYVELQEELREIDQLLGFEQDDEDRGASNAATSSYSPLPKFLAKGRHGKRSIVLTAVSFFALLWLVFVFLRTLITS